MLLSDWDFICIFLRLVGNNLSNFLFVNLLLFLLRGVWLVRLDLNQSVFFVNLCFNIEICLKAGQEMLEEEPLYVNAKQYHR